MRHGIHGRKFGRYSGHRKSLLANLANSLIKHGHIKTTLPKAKDLRPYVEKLVTLGKSGQLHNRRRAISILKNRESVSLLMSGLAERFKDRKGGYTRIIKAGNRHGDNAPMAIIEFVDFCLPEEKIDDDINKEQGAEEKETTES